MRQAGPKTRTPGQRVVSGVPAVSTSTVSCKPICAPRHLTIASTRAILAEMPSYWQPPPVPPSVTRGGVGNLSWLFYPEKRKEEGQD